MRPDYVSPEERARLGATATEPLWITATGTDDGAWIYEVRDGDNKMIGTVMRRREVPRG